MNLLDTELSTKRQAPSGPNPGLRASISDFLDRRFLGRWAPGLIAVVLLLGFDARAEVRLGSEVLVARGFRELQGKRVGLLTNPSGVNRKGEWTVDVFRTARNVNLVALFGPEHGLYGKVKAGDKIKGGMDERTGLPVYSLYGANRKPTPAMLKGLDVLVYDLQDTGTRSYTYISTMGLAMEACAEAGVEFLVLDRPNPLGGMRVEGPLIDDNFRSFVGRWDVPYVYGMTCGELARMINGEGWLKAKCRLTVIPLERWRRSMTWQATGLDWVATSPNIPDIDSVFGYPSLGLLGEFSGGSGLSIGGVIRLPFKGVTASWLDANRLAVELKRANLPGLAFPLQTVRVAKREYRVVRIKVVEPVLAPLVAINFHVLEAVRNVSGRDLLQEAERPGRSVGLFDKAAGSDMIRKQVRSGWSAAAITRSWRSGEEAFRKQRWPYLLYKDQAASSSVGDPYTEVVIGPGDTFFRIAHDHQVSVERLMSANPNLDAHRLQIGARVRVPQP